MNYQEFIQSKNKEMKSEQIQHWTIEELVESMEYAKKCLEQLELLKNSTEEDIKTMQQRLNEITNVR